VGFAPCSRALEPGILLSSALERPVLAGPRRTAEYGDELALEQPAPRGRCTTQSISVGVRGLQWLREEAEGEELSHPGWRYRLDGPSRGALASPTTCASDANGDPQEGGVGGGRG
jgi:hypothetical protein